MLKRLGNWTIRANIQSPLVERTYKEPFFIKPLFTKKEEETPIEETPIVPEEVVNTKEISTPQGNITRSTVEISTPRFPENIPYTETRRQFYYRDGTPLSDEDYATVKKQFDEGRFIDRTTLNGKTVFNVGYMGPLIDLLNSEGIQYRIGGGQRAPGATYGSKNSYHYQGLGLDINSPDGSKEGRRQLAESLSRIRDKIRNLDWRSWIPTDSQDAIRLLDPALNNRHMAYIHEYGDLLKRTGGTGEHFHFGIDNITQDFKYADFIHNYKLN